LKSDDTLPYNFSNDTLQLFTHSFLSNILLGIYEVLKEYNPYAGELQLINEMTDEVRVLHGGELIEKDTVKLRATINANMSLLEVGAITDDFCDGNVAYKIKLNGGTTTIASGSRDAEPLLYMLLFPCGEKGWGLEDKNTVSFTNHLCSRLLIPEQDGGEWRLITIINDKGEPLTLWGNDWTMLNKDSTRLLRVSRFTVLSRLKQYYMVECMSRALDYRIEWHKKNRSLIFGMEPAAIAIQDDEKAARRADRKKQRTAQASASASAGIPRRPISIDTTRRRKNASAGTASASTSAGPPTVSHGHSNEGQDPEREVAHNSSPSYLAESYSGGPRHLKTCALNALTAVSELGDATGFITLTTNVLWPEIKEKLLPGQTAFEAPEIVCQVFKARLAAFMNNLK
jgi:hypothetical protein